MKKSFVIGYCILLKCSFSFSPMKEIYYMKKNNYVIRDNKKIHQVKNKEEFMTLKKTEGFFLYDSNTCNALHIDDIELNRSDIFKILSCDFDSDPEKFDVDNARSLMKRNNFFGGNEPIPLIENKIPPLAFKSFQMYKQKINLFENFHSISGVTIKNTLQGVILNREGSEKNVDLTLALRKYFDHYKLQTDFAQAIADGKINEEKNREFSSKNIEQKLKNLDHAPLNEEDLKLLNHSRILCVFALMFKKKEMPQLNLDSYNEEGYHHRLFIYNNNIAHVKNRKNDVTTGYINPIDFDWKPYVEKLGRRTIFDTTGPQTKMIGIARDERTKKLFYWSTDLGKDISILMQYAEETNINPN